MTLLLICWIHAISWAEKYNLTKWWRERDKPSCIILCHDDVIKWKHFPRYWPFVRGIHRSPGNSPHKGQWGGALMFSLICGWINDWVNNREAGVLRSQRGHYDVTVLLYNPWSGVFASLRISISWLRSFLCRHSNHPAIHVSCPAQVSTINWRLYILSWCWPKYRSPNKYFLIYQVIYLYLSSNVIFRWVVSSCTIVAMVFATDKCNCIRDRHLPPCILRWWVNGRLLVVDRTEPFH